MIMANSGEVKIFILCILVNHNSVPVGTYRLRMFTWKGNPTVRNNPAIDYVVVCGMCGVCRSIGERRS